MERSRVSTKGQTVIPKAVREALHIGEGTELVWQVRDGVVEVIPVAEDPITALIGILKDMDYSSDDLVRDRMREREEEEEKADDMVVDEFAEDDFAAAEDPAPMDVDEGTPAASGKQKLLPKSKARPASSATAAPKPVGSGAKAKPEGPLPKSGQRAVASVAKAAKSSEPKAKPLGWSTLSSQQKSGVVRRCADESPRCLGKQFGCFGGQDLVSRGAASGISQGPPEGEGWQCRQCRQGGRQGARGHGHRFAGEARSGFVARDGRSPGSGERTCGVCACCCWRSSSQVSRRASALPSTWTGCTRALRRCGTS